MVIFVKRMEKETLNENFKEAIKVEKYLTSVHGKIEIDNDKPSTFVNKQGTQTNNTFEKKDQDSLELESMAITSKKLSNDVVDINKMAFENTNQTFNKPLSKLYNPPMRKTQTFTQEAHLGKLNNFIRYMNAETLES